MDLRDASERIPARVLLARRLRGLAECLPSYPRHGFEILTSAAATKAERGLSRSAFWLFFFSFLLLFVYYYYRNHSCFSFFFSEAVLSLTSHVIL